MVSSAFSRRLSILFVSSDEDYVERYGSVKIAVDPLADGILAIIPDENVVQATSWLIVLEAGAPFPAHRRSPDFYPAP